MEISGLDCKYSTSFVNSLVLGFQVGIDANAKERMIECVFMYFRFCVAAMCLRGTSMLSE